MEIRRVLLGKTFLATLAALLLLSSFFFLYQQADARGDYRAYGRIYHESLKSLDDLTWEEGLNQTLDFQKTAREKMKEDSTWKTNLENTHTLRAMEQIQSQYEHLLAYHDYIRQIQQDAKKLQAVSLFSDPESTGYKNTVKTAEDFLSLEHSNLSLGHDLAVTEFFEDQWSDYACVILMLFVCGTLITERKGDLWSLVHATKGGRASLAGKRILILFLAAWIGTVLLVGSKVLLSCWIYHGFGEWDRPIQSISMFYNVPDAMTVGQFWFLYVGVKAMGSFLLGLIFWLLLSSISNLNLAMGAVGLLLAGEYACTTIASSSAFALLRYCNIFSYIQYVRVFIQYLNLPVFGVLISGSDLVLVLVLPLCLIFSVLNISVAVWKYPVTSKGYVMRWLDRVRKKTDHWTCGGSLQIQEAKKLLLRRRGLLVLLLLGLVLIQHPAPERKYDPLNMYFDYFQAKYAGPITEETFSHIMTELSQPQESGRIDALSWMLLEMETAPEGAWLIPSAPYDAIWSDNLENYHRRTALLALLFLVLLLHPIGSQERQSGMDVLHRTASGGRLRLWRRKQVLIFGKECRYRFRRCSG